ncbi:unnamed protein product [Heterosigma akashiwo]
MMSTSQQQTTTKPTIRQPPTSQVGFFIILAAIILMPNRSGPPRSRPSLDCRRCSQADAYSPAPADRGIPPLSALSSHPSPAPHPDQQAQRHFPRAPCSQIASATNCSSPPKRTCRPPAAAATTDTKRSTFPWIGQNSGVQLELDCRLSPSTMPELHTASTTASSWSSVSSETPPMGSPLRKLVARSRWSM